MIEIIKSSKAAPLTALLCCALWGISTPIVKIGSDYVDPSHIPSLILWAGIQFFLAGICTVAISSIFAKKPLLPGKNSLKGICLISLFQTVLQYSLLYIGLMGTSSVKGAILKSTDVFMVTLIATLIFRLEKLTRRKLLSCIIGFLGIIIMNLNGLSLSFSLAGDGVVLLAIASYSLSVIITKLFAAKEDPLLLSGWQMLLGGAAMLLLGLTLGGSFVIASLLPIILVLSAIYAVSYSLWSILLKYNDASKIIIFSFTTPLFGVLSSYLWLNESSGINPLNMVIALILVCFGVLLASYQKS